MVVLVPSWAWWNFLLTFILSNRGVMMKLCVRVCVRAGRCSTDSSSVRGRGRISEVG